MSGLPAVRGTVRSIRPSNKKMANKTNLKRDYQPFIPLLTGKSLKCNTTALKNKSASYTTSVLSECTSTVQLVLTISFMAVTNFMEKERNSRNNQKTISTLLISHVGSPFCIDVMMLMSEKTCSIHQFLAIIILISCILSRQILLFTAATLFSHAISTAVES